MRRTNQRSLPTWVEEAYEVLASHIDGHQEGISREHAYTLLRDQDGLRFDAPTSDVKYTVKQLLLRGYLYEVDGELFVMIPDH